MKVVTVTFVVGIALIFAVVALVLTESSPTRTLHTGVPNASLLTLAYTDTTICQSGETIPSGTTGVRLSMWTFFGSTVQVTAFNGSQIVTEGQRGPNWTSTSVTVPVKRVTTTQNVRLCIRLAPNSEPLLLLGAPVKPKEAGLVVSNRTPMSALASSSGKALSGRLGVSYVAAAPGSWWSRIVSTARHIGLGHVLNGTWVAFLIAALMAAVGVLSVRLALREIP